ncbi:MAG: MerR family transcriptional regulator [Coriobacteriales bacterium]|jgi:DNA-binding transcriptional MerR regulator|nr:MerR family transcriptional regulator [Coriobacteriales bacterium]
MYRIGAFSKLGKTTVKTLRHYDECGLLKPQMIDPQNGYRYYTTSQLLRLHDIVALRQMGFSLAQIAGIIDGHDDEQSLQARRAELAAEQQTATLRLMRMDNYLRERKEGLSMSYQAIIKELPGCTVFSARRKLGSYADLGTVMPAVGATVAAANPDLCCSEPEYCCIIFRDGEYRESDIDVEICQAVECCGKTLTPGEDFEFKELPATTVVSVLHRGPYSTIGAAYGYAYDWLERNGYTPADDPRESYIDGVWNCDSEADWLTELQIPVTHLPH